MTLPFLRAAAHFRRTALLALALVGVAGAYQVPGNYSGPGGANTTNTAGPVTATFSAPLTIQGQTSNVSLSYFSFPAAGSIATARLNSIGAPLATMFSPNTLDVANTPAMYYVVPGTGCTPNSTATGNICNAGTLTVTFSRPVTNPIMHVSGIGGISSGTNTNGTTYDNRARSIYTIATPGVTFQSLGSPNNLSVTSTQLTSASTDPATSCQATTNGRGTVAGCGTVQLTGTFTSVTFNVQIGVRRIFGTDTVLTDDTAVADGVSIAFTVDEDYGDAPNTYNGGVATSNVIGDLRLGTGVTVDAVSTVSPAASPVASADATGDTDDAFSAALPILPLSGTYSLTVPVSGASAAGRVCGWIDFGKDGTFNTTTEQACTAIAAGASSATLNFTIPATTFTPAEFLFVRLRTAYGAVNLTPTGRLDSGETEDYRVQVYAPQADLQVTKTNNGGTTDSGTDSLAPGATTTYTIRVTNAGPDSVTGAVLRDPTAGGLTVSSATCSPTPGQCTAAPTVAALQGAGVSLPALNSGQFYEIRLTGTVSGAAGTTVTNTATIATPSGTNDPNTANNSATDSDPVLGPPLQCTTTMYGIFGTNPSTDISLIKSIDASGNVGATVTTIPTSATNTTPYTDNAAMAVSPDGSKVFVAGGDNVLRVYNVLTAQWEAFVSFPNSGSRMIRMAVDPSGTGYMGTGDQIWTFSTTSPYTVSSPGTISYTDSSGLTPTPFIKDDTGTPYTSGVSKVNSGDFIVSSTGAVFLLANPAIFNGTSFVVQNYIDVFRILNPGSAAPTAAFYGRITDTDIGGVSYGGYASLSSSSFGISGSGRFVSVNLATVSVTPIIASGTATISTDLTSCYYPVLQPTITATKTVKLLDSATGLELTRPALPGDTLEYTIVTRNSGTLGAANITLQDAIPAGTTYVAGSTTLNSGAISDVSGAMPFAATAMINSPLSGSGVLKVDTTPATTTTSPTDADDNEAVVTFRVKINAGTTEVRNRATIVHVDGTTTSNETVTSTGAPALSVTKTVSNPVVLISDAGAATPTQLTYTITVTNTGTAAALNVQTTDTLPTGLTYVSATGTPALLAGQPSQSGQTLTFTQASLAAGSSQVYTVTVGVAVTANTNNAAFLNTATASATTVSAVTSTPARTDIVYPKLTKRVRNVTQNSAFGTTGGGLPGEILEYCIDFNNYGSLALPNFVISDNVPANTGALLTAYDAAEPSATTGFGVKLVRGASTTYLTSAAADDAGTLTNAGGTYSSGTMTVNLSTLNIGESGSACFQTTIR